MAVRRNNTTLLYAANLGAAALQARAIYHLIDRSALEAITLDAFLRDIFPEEQLNATSSLTHLVGEDQTYWHDLVFKDNDFVVVVEHLKRFIPERRQVNFRATLSKPSRSIARYMDAVEPLLAAWDVVRKLITHFGDDNVMTSGRLGKPQVPEPAIIKEWPAVMALAKAGGGMRNPQGATTMYISGSIKPILRDTTETILSAALLPEVPKMASVYDGPPSFSIKKSLHETPLCVVPFRQSE